MRGDKIITDYFNGRQGYMRRFVDAVDIGETLSARKIADRTGIPFTKVFYLMHVLETRGIVKRVPFVWPSPPSKSVWWGRRRWSEWRKTVRGNSKGRPSDKWQFLDFLVTPIEELLKLAKIDQREAEI